MITRPDGDGRRTANASELVADQKEADGFPGTRDLHILKRHWRGPPNAWNSGDRVLKVLRQARTLGEWPPRVLLDDPNLSGCYFHYFCRIADQSAVDSAHCHHDGQQESQANAGECEAHLVAANITKREVHGLSPVGFGGRYKTGAHTLGIGERQPASIRLKQYVLRIRDAVQNLNISPLVSGTEKDRTEM